MSVRGNKQLNRALRIFLAITKKSSLEDGFPLSVHLERTRDSLFEHGLTLSVEFGKEILVDTIDFSGTAGRIVLEDDIIALRKASEDLRPGLPRILRVIVCPTDDFKFGETYRNRSIGDLFFLPFVLMNSRQVDRSHATLLHEMIHAANNGPIKHDKEPNNIFFENGTTQLGEVNRTTLKPEHAAKLAQAFFAALRARSKTSNVFRVSKRSNTLLERFCGPNVIAIEGAVFLLRGAKAYTPGDSRKNHLNLPPRAPVGGRFLFL